MKQTLLFVAIMLLFGSLTKPPIQPCSKTIYLSYYKDGKLVYRTTRDSFSYLSGLSKLFHDTRSNKIFYCDSMTIKIYNSNKKQ